MPFPGAFSCILVALSQSQVNDVPPEVVLAVCQRESMCNPFFCKCDKLFTENLDAMARCTGLRKDLLTKKLSVEGPGGMVQISKFRFEPTWWSLLTAESKFKDLDPYEKALLSCSLGIGQKWSFALVQKMDGPERDLYLKHFMLDPAMQIRTLIGDLHSCITASGGDWELALTRYNSGIHAQRISGYGAQVYTVAKAFMQIAQKLQGVETV